MTTSALPPAFEARFAAARKVADAVLFEGYVLYPYRASAAKNRLRWQFGVLVPPDWGTDSGEHSFQRTECLMEPRREATLLVELRFLHTQRRIVQEVRADGGHLTVPRLELADRVLTPWDEGVEERVQLAVPVDELMGQPIGERGGERVGEPEGEGLEFPFAVAARDATETVRDEAGRPVGRLLLRREAVSGLIRLTATALPGPYAVQRLTAVVENTSAWPSRPVDADREAALPRSLVSAHLVLGLSAGSFLSMADPPEWARAAAAECRNLRTWPVLAGEDGRPDVMLSSPIILEDHPAIAPESPGALYDALEIDEILTLRTSALTDEEKREARGTDPRAAAVIDLADTMPPEVLERLHGAVRSLREITGTTPTPTPSFSLSPSSSPPRPNDLAGLPGLPGTGDSPDFPDSVGFADRAEEPMRPEKPWWDPESDGGFDPDRDRVVVDGRPVGAGSRVLLRPGLRRTDAQDLFLHGRNALVEAVLHDVDGGVHLAVTVEGDPGADVRREQGRFLYFRPDEVTPLPDGTTGLSDGVTPLEDA
ncbi:hypothetical protein ACWEFL_17045 [Streptomyces sp. NPDC004838]